MSHLILYRIEPPIVTTVEVDSMSQLSADSLVVDLPLSDSVSEEPYVEPIAILLEKEFLTFLNPDEQPAAMRYREVAPEAIFSAASVQAEIPFGGGLSSSLTATPTFGLLVLSILCFYCLMLYQHLSDAVQLLARVTREHTTGDRLSEESIGGYNRFLTLCTILGILLAGVASMRYFAPWLPMTPLAVWPRTAAFVGALSVAVALCFIWLYQLVITLFIGRLTYTQQLLEQIYLLKRTSFAMLTLVATPFLALWLLTPVGEGNVWFWMIIIALIFTLVLYLYETLSLFISKKISILHWFLYLCGVEIFPISLLVLLVVR